MIVVGGGVLVVFLFIIYKFFGEAFMVFILNAMAAFVIGGIVWFIDGCNTGHGNPELFWGVTGVVGFILFLSKFKD